MKPAISVLCCTYGRTRCLPEVVESFRKQSYEGPMELVILNDAAEQTIKCDTPNVRIINEKNRSKTLGDKRNLINTYASHFYRLTVDDDDVFLPWYIEDMIAGLIAATEKDLGFYLAPRNFFSKGTKERFQITTKGKLSGCPAYTKTLFEQCGGYPSMHSGQDQALLSRFKQKIKEKHIKEASRPGYIYKWANNVHHLSGGGPNNPEQWAEAQKKFLAHPDEPKGEVIIKPKWEIDYIKACTPLL